MKVVYKAMTRLMILFALSAKMLCAQIPSSVKFTTPFPFYVNDQYMPAGSYTVTEPNMNSAMLLIEDQDCKHVAYFQYIPADTLTPVGQGLATFRQYGDVDFLASLTVAGETSGVYVPPDKLEKRTSAERELASNENGAFESVPLEAMNTGN